MIPFPKFCPSMSVAALVAGLIVSLAACGSDPAPTATPQPEATAAPQSEPTATTAPTQPPAPTSTPTPAPTATPTPAPTPTPTPAPTPTQSAESALDELLSSVEGKLAGMNTATFTMVDETESGAKFFGTTFKSLEGSVKSPDSF